MTRHALLCERTWDDMTHVLLAFVFSRSVVISRPRSGSIQSDYFNERSAGRSQLVHGSHPKIAQTTAAPIAALHAVFPSQKSVGHCAQFDRPLPWVLFFTSL